jgi:hypothetical protein
MGDWPKRLAVGLAALQLADVIGNVLVPRRHVDAHLDHLGVPTSLRPALPVIKVAGSAGLVGGVKSPLLGAATAACLVGFYAAAVAFHVRAGEHPVVWLPAIAFGATAATSLVTFCATGTSDRVRKSI